MKCVEMETVDVLISRRNEYDSAPDVICHREDLCCNTSNGRSEPIVLVFYLTGSKQAQDCFRSSALC